MKGSQWKWIEKIRIAIKPEKKVGIENPKKAKVVATWSKTEYCFTAARMPIGRAMIRLRMKAKPITKSVVEMRPEIRPRTPVRDEKEKPQSPLTQDEAHLAYCTGIGSSSPSCLRMFRRTSGGTEGFAANCAIGSPGASLRIAKMIMLITTRVGIAVSKRRIM